MLQTLEGPDALRGMSNKQLVALAAEIRKTLIDTVAQNGGHLASNLGMVELTIALHCVFHAPEDKLVFDVGHQSYTHKILTGRADRFATLRQKDGLSGFPRCDESEYDAFSTGHASTAISAALGMARARMLMGGHNSVVAILGDGALTGGMCYEALNDAGQTKTPLIVVLNDNAMSISRNVGALSSYLTRLRQSGGYASLKRGVRYRLSRVPGVGKGLTTAMERMRDALKALLINDRFFEALGFEYVGPIDGHDIKRMKRVLNRVKNTDHPVLVHVVTQKGRGYAYAENHPEDFHGVAPFFVESGQSIGHSHSSNGQVMAAELIDMAERDIRVAAITAAMPQGTGLSAFAARFPERFYDVGIAEEHAVTMAAGMAAAGLKPYVAIYSSFLQRAYDQLLIDVCSQNLPVTLLLDRGGLCGADGATHQGVFDLSYLRQMPGMVVAAPRDVRDLKRLLWLSLEHNGPMAIRYAKDAIDMGPGMQERGPLRVGEWELLAAGEDVVMLVVGRMVEVALQTSIELHGKQIRCGVVDARFIKPLDEDMLREIAQGPALLVTLEDNALAGGFGSAVLEKLAEWGMQREVLTIGVPDRFIAHATVTEQMEELGLTPAAIAQKIIEKRGA